MYHHIRGVAGGGGGGGCGGEEEGNEMWQCSILLRGPSKTTRDKLKGGYTTRSGVLKDLLLAFITLVDESPNSKLPL